LLKFNNKFFGEAELQQSLVPFVVRDA